MAGPTFDLPVDYWHVPRSHINAAEWFIGWPILLVVSGWLIVALTHTITYASHAAVAVQFLLMSVASSIPLFAICRPRRKMRNLGMLWCRRRCEWARIAAVAFLLAMVTVFGALVGFALMGAGAGPWAIWVLGMLLIWQTWINHIQLTVALYDEPDYARSTFGN